MLEKNRQRVKTTGVIVKPMLSNNFNYIAQMDLVDFQTLPDLELRWLMVYQDHLTKFIHQKWSIGCKFVQLQKNTHSIQVSK